MCIRDSLWSSHTALTLEEKKVLTIQIIQQNPDFGVKFGIEPVSYTHLDVYKRQAQYSQRPEEWVPEAATFETAKSYREKKAIPLIQKLVKVCLLYTSASITASSA